MLRLTPHPATRAQRRLKRKRRRQRISRFLLLLFLLIGLGAASVPPETALSTQLAEITASYQFDFVAWETGALSDELGRRWAAPALPNDPVERRALVETFLRLEQQIRDLGQELDDLYAGQSNPSDSAESLQGRLSRLKAEQAGLTPQVETILIQQVETILREEGFTLAGRVFTPPAFRFIDPPTALIISPRDHIENQQMVTLAPGLDNSRRFQIEASLDQRGDISSYVTNIGGLGSYPTMVVTFPSLPWLVEVVAHEWTHNYFFTFPSNMAWGYDRDPAIRTINETTAELVGQEVGRKVISRFYPDLVDQLPPLDATGQPTPAEPSEFDLAMRRIRLHVDALLSQGQIEAAETYMERERLQLVEQGYGLRKLNQAYFAFHGAYALSPASTDPTGTYLRALRGHSPSLKAFVDRVGHLNNEADLLRWLHAAGLEPEPGR
jgi:hypothetical protein